ncbi:TPA: helix-turn-helix transcriptional regulator [Clostridium perfringens]|uniref:helix-turn-helix domain-containing protein n=1 Tax=Clostridium perfringens TaxID=1502 RepID=UPI0010D20120|nr:helix-turn-helix transcriptional regulator [Clostridium perfringens]EJT5924473.1 helix-turn-helix transcriptional regulator [Clostridium perfringens]EJT6150466.1 helix-turn-helix transcriptional regulator [Clostridium perfringens]EJT6156090.1 helix-turn-helix transcriptional regulator [Clostridium perfringens]UBK67023.1 helix-turn-helix domain-containing protein [Clostridium perfringens]VTQ60220.1 transcriptional regulator sinR [Clostridium perfringens]
MNIGKNIRRIRKSKGLTIRDLSKKSEVSQGYISDLENERETRPSLDILGKLANALEVSITNFLEVEIYDELPLANNYRDALIGLTNYINYVTRKNNCELNDIDSEEIVELIESIVLTKIKFYKKKRAR